MTDTLYNNCLQGGNTLKDRACTTNHPQLKFWILN